MYSAVDIYLSGVSTQPTASRVAPIRFIVAQGRWERIVDLPEPLHHMPLAVANDTLYAVGGYSGGFIGRTTFGSTAVIGMCGSTCRSSCRAWRLGGRGLRGKPRRGRRTGPDRPRVDVRKRSTIQRRTACAKGAAIPTTADHLAAGVVTMCCMRSRTKRAELRCRLKRTTYRVNRWTTRAPMPSRRAGLPAS